MIEEGLSDHLVLLSIYQTCKYRGVSFLKVLLSREDDVETFCQLERKKRRTPPLEIYPKGFPRRYNRQKQQKSTKSETGTETAVSGSSTSPDKTENQDTKAGTSGSRA